MKPFSQKALVFAIASLGVVSIALILTGRFLLLKYHRHPDSPSRFSLNTGTSSEQHRWKDIDTDPMNSPTLSASPSSPAVFGFETEKGVHVLVRITPPSPTKRSSVGFSIREDV
jgi:hypothetical protein